MTLATAAACLLQIAAARAEVVDVGPPEIAYTPAPGLDAVYRFESRYLGGEGRGGEAAATSTVHPSLSGSVLRPWLRFESEAELAEGQPSLLASYLEIQALDELGFRLGLEDRPPSRRDDDGPAHALFPESDGLADYFWPDHDQGITAFGSLGEDLVDWAAGVYGGAAPSAGPAAGRGAGYVAEARLTVTPLGGDAPESVEPLQGALGLRLAAARAAARETAGAVDLMLRSRRLALMGEGYWRRTTPAAGAAWTSLGAWGEMGLLLVRRALEAAVRVSWANPSTTLAWDRLLQQQLQLAWQVRGSPLVVRARYGWSDQQGPNGAGRGGIRLPAAPGRIQVVTLQIDVVL